MDGGLRMRRSRALTRGRWLPLLAAGMVGYVLGDWHTIAMRTAELSAPQSVALRFPEANDEPVTEPAPATPARATNAIILGDTSAVLLSPAPMIASAVRQPSAPAQQPGAPQAPVRVATAADTLALASMPAAAAAPAQRTLAATTQAAPEAKAETKIEPRPDVKAAAATPPKSETKPAGAAAEGARSSNRQVYVLNDTQIASIKRRLHLSPDQEQMWPAVEAALRSIAYSKSRDGHHRGGATSAEVASLDPYGPEVQGLKSAAFPLIMSFSDEQRSEVRTIAHVMGLDQLASQL
jgi:hypothetical protein